MSDGQVSAGADEEIGEVDIVESEDIDVLFDCGLGSVLPNCDESGEFQGADPFND